MLAYVFWHWKSARVDAADYEDRQRAFHATLRADPPEGFVSSLSIGISGIFWAGSGGEAYEDWYLVDGFGALGALNEGAVTGSRTRPHDAAAQGAESGAGGVYALRLGPVVPSPAVDSWFAKPAGMSYPELFRLLEPVTATPGVALWMRQMVLGPAPEFCLQSESAILLPNGIEAIDCPLRIVYAEAAAGLGAENEVDGTHHT